MGFLVLYKFAYCEEGANIECGDIKFHDQEGKITNSQICHVVVDGSMQKKQFSSD